MTDYSPSFLQITNQIDNLMIEFVYTRKDIGYGYRRTFSNNMWFDVIDYHKKGINILRVGRGAWLARQYPMLYAWFDNISKVIGKIQIYDIYTLDQKNIIGILRLINSAPSGIGVFE